MSRFPAISLACLLAAVYTHAQGQVFVGQDASGAIVLSNFQGGAASELLIAPEPRPIAAAVLPNASAALPLAYAPAPNAPRNLALLIEEAAREHALPASLIQAVVAVESGYNANAVSPKGAKGLMQLMPQTAQRFGVRDPFDARSNIQAGTQYLKWLLGTFGGDLELALAGYNAGENAVIRSGYKVPAIRETQDYVPKVLARFKQFSEQ